MESLFPVSRYAPPAGPEHRTVRSASQHLTYWAAVAHMYISQS